VERFKKRQAAVAAAKLAQGMKEFRPVDSAQALRILAIREYQGKTA
jgi:hypothetical protein